MATDLSNRMGCVFCTDGFPKTCAVERVQKALEESGLSPELAKAVQKRGCFSRAKARLKDEGLILEVTRQQDGTGRWLWQLSDKYVQDNKLMTKYRAQFWFDREKLTVGADNPELQAEIERLFAEYGGLYLANDLMRLVHRVFTDCKGLLPLRRAGGVYFVPEVHRPTLEKVMTFLQRIGCVDCIVTNVGTVGEGSLRDKAVAMLIESTQSRLKSIQEELRTLDAAEKKLGKRRANGRWNELQEQLQRIRTFATSLGVGVESIMEQASTSEIKLATIASGDLETMASMAHAGKLDSEALAKIVKAATAEKAEELPEATVREAEATAQPRLDFDTAAVAAPEIEIETEIEVEVPTTK